MNATVAPERVALSVFETPSQSNLPIIFQMPEDRAIATLCGSLYPGANPDSARMVLDYCRASALDPMQKPVHIVPMSVKVGQKENGDDLYETRDVVMAGIGLYRIQATRTGSYAGQDEPEFGPNTTLSYRKKETTWEGQAGQRRKREEWVNAELTFPLWCKVTVYRIVQGVRYAFTAKELWLENYGTASRWSDAPNAMWEKRTFAQLAKCAEAQALRKAFPDAVSSAPTAEELEGKQFDFELGEDGNTSEASRAPAAQPPRKATAPAQGPAPEPSQPAAEPAGPADVGATPSPPPQSIAQASAAQAPAAAVFMATGGEKQNIVVRCRNARRDQAELLASVLGDGHGVNPVTFEGLTKEQFKKLRAAFS